jgi:hypothetical protein
LRTNSYVHANLVQVEIQADANDAPTSIKSIDEKGQQ